MGTFALHPESIIGQEHERQWRAAGPGRRFLILARCGIRSAACLLVPIIQTNGMGNAIGDYDNDGDLDWFASSIYGEVNDTNDWQLGNRGQRTLYPTR